MARDYLYHVILQMMEKIPVEYFMRRKYVAILLILFLIEIFILPQFFNDEDTSRILGLITFATFIALFFAGIFMWKTLYNSYKNEISIKEFKNTAHSKDSLLWSYYPKIILTIKAAKIQFIVLLILFSLLPEMLLWKGHIIGDLLRFIIGDLLVIVLAVYGINGGFRANVVEVSSEGITINNNFKSWKNFLYYKSDKNLNIIKIYNKKYFLLRSIFPIIIFADKNFDDVERKISNYLRKAG